MKLPVLKREFSIKKEGGSIDITRIMNDVIETPELFERRRSIPPEIGTGYMTEIRLRKGMTVFIEDVMPVNDMLIDVDTEEYPLRFMFTMKGDLEIRNLLTGYERVLESGASDLTFTSKPLKGSMKKNGGQRTSRITLLIEPEEFKNLISDEPDSVPIDLRRLLDGGRGPDFSRTIRQTPVVMSVLYQILNCRYENLSRVLFMESKALELIALQLNSIPLADARHLADNDDKIYEARNILLNSMEAPPGLFELAKMVGLSHTNLNKGFHRVFNTTVFGYLRTARLEAAKRYLLEGDMNVTEAACAVGYSSLSHFSMAFKEYTGYYPGDLLKTS